MFKLLGVIALVTICFAVESAAQVPVPPPINVPAPVNSSHITISREIMRTAAKRAGRRNSRQRKSVNAAKSPTTNPPINKSPTSKSPTSTSPTTKPKVSVVNPPVPSSTDAKISNTGPAGLARQLPSVYGPYLANIGRVRIVQQGKLGSASTRPARVAASDTAFRSSVPAFVPQQLAERLGKTQQEREYVEGVLTKCLNFYIDTAISKRVPLNDVALALNYFISTNYFVYSSGGGPTPSQMSATRDLIRANMAQDDAFRRMSDKDKQEAYETLIVLAGFVDLGYGTSKQSGDTSAAAEFREMAKYNLETLLGAPIEKIHFTNAGLALN
jgi:hypothetical protein